MPQNGRTVLIVEDDEDLSIAIADVLDDFGFVTERVASGLQALARLQVVPLPDAMLLDVWIPGLNGRELFRQIQSSLPLGRIQVVLMSGSSTTPWEGVTWLQKPVSADQLLEALGAP